MSHPEKQRLAGELHELATDDTVGNAATAVTQTGADVRRWPMGTSARADVPAAPERTGADASTRSHSEALLVDEVGRTRAFLVVVLSFHVIMPVVMQLMDGDPQVSRILYAAMATTFLPSAWLFWHLRDPANYDTWRVTAVMLAVTTTTYVGVFWWGVFSPAPCLIVMGIFFFCRAQSFGAAVVIFAVCAGYQAVLSGLVIAGVLTDRGLFPFADMTRFQLALTQGMVQVVYGFTFWMARSSRRTTLAAFGRLERAVREVAQRDAQLQEARLDFDRALGVGGAGRYTDHTLGNYRVGAVIGRGTMGEVYEATHVDTGDIAAVKVLHSNVLESPELVERFLREARIAGAFRTQHVARVLDRSAPGDPLPYLVMERLRGNDLAKQLRDMRRLPLQQLVDMIRQVGTVIDEARKQGIVHRDLKPQNLLLATQPAGKSIWKVLDFGVSKLAEHSGTLTQGGVVGTPAYMAPEQARGDDVDHRADLYALAAIAYRCITGRPPFQGKDLMSILYNVINDTPPRPSEVSSVATAFDAVLAKGMAKAPGDRFDSGAELADALAAAGETSAGSGRS